MLYRKYKDKKEVSFLAVAFICFLLLLFPDYAFAGPELVADPANTPSIQRVQDSVAATEGSNSLNFLSSPIDYTLYLIAAFFGTMAGFSGTLLDWLLNAKVFDQLFRETGRTLLYDTWTVVRDIFNLSFILVLLFSAFSTIFQVEKFHLKKILLTLVLMALLINFSWPIALFIIDAGNAIMYFLLNQLTTDGTLSASLAGESAFWTTLVPKPEIVGASDAGDWGFTIYLMFTIVFVGAFAITLATIAILFLIRLIAFVILLIFSPVGFAAAILPSTQQYSNSWWESLFKWTFMGPVMIFMLVVAVKFMQSFQSITKDGPLFRSILSQNSADGSTYGLNAIFVAGVPIIAAVVIMWAGLLAAQKMGGGVASSIVGSAGKVGKWGLATFSGYRVAKWGAKEFGHKIDRDLARSGGILKYASPTAWKMAKKRRDEKMDRQAFGMSSGQIADAMNKTLSAISPVRTVKSLWKSKGKRWTLGVEKSDEGYMAHEENVAKHAKEIKDTNPESEYVLQVLEDAINSGDVAKVAGAMKVLAVHNDFNEMMRNIGHKYAAKTNDTSSKSVKTTLEDMFKKAGTKDQEFIAKQLMGIGEISLANGGFGFGGMGKFDKDLYGTGKGGFKVSSDKEQADYVSGKMQNFETQFRQTKLHHNTLLIEKADGTQGGVNGLVGKQAFGTIGKGDAEVVTRRTRGDLLRQLKNFTETTDETQADQRAELLKSNPALADYFEKAAGAAPEDSKKGKPDLIIPTKPPSFYKPPSA